MYRACGRMFVVADSNQLKKDLEGDINRIKAETERSNEMQKSFEAKKAVLTAQLNDLTPKELQKWVSECVKQKQQVCAKGWTRSK